MNYSFEFETLINLSEEQEDVTIYIEADGYQPQADWDLPDVVLTSITDEDGTDLTDELTTDQIKELNEIAYEKLYNTHMRYSS